MRCNILQLKCTKFDFGAGELIQRSPGPLAGFKGLVVATASAVTEYIANRQRRRCESCKGSERRRRDRCRRTSGIKAASTNMYIPSGAESAFIKWTAWTLAMMTATDQKGLQWRARCQRRRGEHRCSVIRNALAHGNRFYCSLQSQTEAKSLCLMMI